MLQKHLLGAAMAHAIGGRLQEDQGELSQAERQAQEQRALQKAGAHIPLMKRAREPSIEERFAKAGIDPALLALPPSHPRAAEIGAEAAEAEAALAVAAAGVGR
jgi:hypothetical protein